MFFLDLYNSSALLMLPTLGLLTEKLNYNVLFKQVLNNKIHFLGISDIEMKFAKLEI